MNQRENLLIVSASEHDADMLYATGIFVPDPFIFLRARGRPCLVMSDLEIDRARRDTPHCRVMPLSRYVTKLRADGVKSPGLPQALSLFLREAGIKRAVVPHGFPLGLAAELQRNHIRVKPRQGSFFPQREQKSAAEVKKISAALMMAEIGMAEAIQALRLSRIARDKRLLYHNVPLTSEKLRGIIDTAILQVSGLASRTIVAGGKQGCDPHEIGHGPLRANEPIIIDIFPRSQTTGYFGDITRTVVRGRATDALRELYDTVLQGQALAFKQMRSGQKTADIHKSVLNFFQRRGFKTGKRNGRMQGFFHGTGHGLGLEIHEPPRVGLNSPGALKAGNVVTVEPGLYYPDLGGVRLEDVALVTNSRPRNLTRFEKALEV